MDNILNPRFFRKVALARTLVHHWIWQCLHLSIISFLSKRYRKATAKMLRIKYKTFLDITIYSQNPFF